MKAVIILPNTLFWTRKERGIIEKVSSKIQELGVDFKDPQYKQTENGLTYIKYEPNEDSV